MLDCCCSQCGYTFPVHEQYAGAKLTCLKCGAATPAPPRPKRSLFGIGLGVGIIAMVGLAIMFFCCLIPTVTVLIPSYSMPNEAERQAVYMAHRTLSAYGVQGKIEMRANSERIRNDPLVTHRVSGVLLRGSQEEPYEIDFEVVPGERGNRWRVRRITIDGSDRINDRGDSPRDFPEAEPTAVPYLIPPVPE